MPVNLSITVGPMDDGTDRYVAAIGNGDDVLGARSDTAESAVLRAVSLYFKVYPDAEGEPAAGPVTITNTFATTQPPVERKRPPRSAVGEDGIRRLIEDAIRRDANVNILYRDGKGNSTSREIEPFRFTDGRESDLVECFDELRGQIRNFRLDRIERAEELPA